MREDILHSILRELNGSSVDVEASAIVSTDGLVMASLLPGDIDEDRLGAMSAAMLSLGDRAARELGRGDLEQVLVRGRRGFILLAHAGADAVLAVLTRREAKLGMVFFDVKRAAAAIAKVL